MHKNAYKLIRILLESKVCVEMPIIRKVIDVGRSKAVTIPKTWLEYYEREFGEEIKLVAIEVDRKLEIVPYIPRENAEKKDEK